MLTRAATTLFWAEAEEICVEAAAPVSTRTTTKARTMDFMVAPFERTLNNAMKIKGLGAKKLAALRHTTGVRIVRSAGGNRNRADAGGNDLVLGGGGGGLGGGGYTGEDEGEDEGADDVFHSGIPLKLYLLKKISLDKPDEVTIGYIME